MNNFEYLRQMRDIRQPVAPRRDLWSDIATRIKEHEANGAKTSGRPHPITGRRSRHRSRRAVLIAASIVALIGLAAGIGLHMTLLPADSPAPLAATPRWQTSDPRLLGASLELDAARMELSQAIRQSPDTAALQRLLIRTERQQDRLRRLEQQAG